MKHGSTTTHLKQKDRQLNGQQLVKAVQSDQKLNSGLARLCHPYFGTRMVFCSSTILYYTSIGETAIQVRWYDNTMYSDRKQNIMQSLSLLWILACDKTMRDTQKWSFKQRKNSPKKLSNSSKKGLKQMTLLSHFEVRLACMLRNV